MITLAGSNFSPAGSSLAIAGMENTPKKRVKTATSNVCKLLLFIGSLKFCAKIVPEGRIPIGEVEKNQL
jgi:hypothetical protein